MLYSPESGNHPVKTKQLFIFFLNTVGKRKVLFSYFEGWPIHPITKKRIIGNKWPSAQHDQAILDFDDDSLSLMNGT